ncbi:hypothetical protein SRB5_65180 [Streptomyces sp. RB5]|uniref:Uncharacterized protein n=1 Tax=Streptomyces smaragdinus TaxID=2585196 RepID=A0A7K0CSB5_9ACTN|nr:hypothetical protein [Streptomyces smaragdinus]
MAFLILAVIVLVALSDEDCCVGCVGMLVLIGFLWLMSYR